MALSREQTDPAYLVGRILAVLNAAEIENCGEQARLTTEEKQDEVQQNPRLIIGQFLSLSHVRKGLTDKLDEELQEIMSKVSPDGLPNERLRPDQWGTAMVGYWHEKCALRTDR